jgi:hypothetical protein
MPLEQKDVGAPQEHHTDCLGCCSSIFKKEKALLMPAKCTSCRHCGHKSLEMMTKWRARESLRKELVQKYDVEVLIEQCFLLQTNPMDSKEYQDALKAVERDLGPPPVLKSLETPATLARLHRQGMLVLQSFLPPSRKHLCASPRRKKYATGMRLQERQKNNENILSRPSGVTIDPQA